MLRRCPDSNCSFNKKIVHADAQQIKKHCRSHSYKELLQTAKNLNLIQEYARPIKGELVDILSENSIVRDN